MVGLFLLFAHINRAGFVFTLVVLEGTIVSIIVIEQEPSKHDA